jgi:hypothetical protein
LLRAQVILTILGQRVYFPHTLPDHVGSKVDDEDVAAEYGEDGHDEQLLGAEPSIPPVLRSDSSDGMVPLDAALSLEDDGTDAEGCGGTAVAGELPEADAGFLSSMVDFRSFNQERMSKKQVLTRLLTCAIGLNVSFLITGIAQERIITRPYSGGEYFTSSYGLVFLNRLGGFIISALLFYMTSPAPTTAIVYEFSFPSVSNMLSSWCQYEALKYVSFPTQSLFKCFKLAPVMLMGKVLG